MEVPIKYQEGAVRAMARRTGWGGDVQRRGGNRNTVSYAQMLTWERPQTGGPMVASTGQDWHKNQNQRGPRIDWDKLKVWLDHAQEMFKISDEGGCRIAVNLQTRMGIPKHTKPNDVADDIMDLMGVVEGNLIHASQIDTDTGLITLTFERRPDLRELKKLTDGEHNGKLLEKSKTKIHRAVVLRCKLTQEEEREERTLTVTNISPGPNMGVEVMKLVNQVEEMEGGEELFERREDEKGERKIAISIEAWQKIVDGKKVEPVRLTGTAKAEFKEKKKMQEVVEKMGGKNNIPATVYLGGQTTTVTFGNETPCNNCNRAPCNNGGERTCTQKKENRVGLEERRRQSSKFLNSLNMDRGRSVQWAPRAMAEAVKPLKKVKVGGVKLLAHSAGSTSEDLEAQVYHDITATIRAAWRDKEGMRKVINAKTTDEKVEIGRRCGQAIR